MMITKRRGLYCTIAILIVTLLLGSSFILINFQKTDSVIRTVSLNENAVDYQELSAEFDEYDVQTNEKDVEIVAKKNFDMSILDELDLVGLDENEETFAVRYEISYIDNDSTIFLTVSMEGINEISVVDTVPGLVSKNSLGEPDVMFVVDGEYIWLSDMIDSGVLNETGWFKNLLKIVQKVVLNTAQAVVKAIAPILKPIVRIASVVVKIKISMQGVALVLNMVEETPGIYYAKEDCWQQYFGYTDFYDTVFNAVTSMRPAKFDFDINNDGVMDYILWAWKGDYLNLGAGAELGIYKRWAYSDDIWIVDKSESMKMTVKLVYNVTGQTLFDREPEEKQWWITGFNSNYKFKNRDNLTASYSVVFNNYTMYNSFKNSWNKGENKWTFDSGLEAKFTF